MDSLPMAANPELIAALTSVVMAIAMWLIVMTAVTKTGIWYKLAEKYAYDGSMQPTKWHNFVSGKFGSAKFNGCLCVGTTQNGLHIKPAGFMMMGPFQKEFRIPWQSIKAIEERKEWGQSFLVFQLADADLSFALKNGEYMEEARKLVAPKTIKLLQEQKEFS